MTTAVTKKKTVAAELATVEIPPIQIERFEIQIVGESPLIMHRFSEKSRKQMLDKMLKVASTAKPPKDPDQEYKDSIYYDRDGDYAIPSIAFKSAIVSACRFTDGMKMTVLRGAVHVDGEFVKVVGEPAPREDVVRVGTGSADIRYRAEFLEWGAKLRIAVNTAVLSFAQVINLVNLAGFGVGVLEWRPERNGSYGRFRVQMEGQ